MEEFLETLYRRLGARSYYRTYAIFDAIAGALLFPPFAVGAFALYVDASAGELLLILLVAQLGTAAGIICAAWRTRARAEAVFGWIDDGRPAEGAPAAWQGAARLQRHYMRTVTWWLLWLAVIPACGLAAIEFDLPAYGILLVFAGGMLLVALGDVTHYFGIEPGLRPLFKDIAERLPADQETSQVRVPLRWKLLGALVLTNVTVAIAVGIVATRGERVSADLGIWIGAAAALAFVSLLFGTLLVASTVLSPIRELLEAMRRVRGGDLSTRVPVRSADEMGMLTRSFNEMMTGLEERETLQEAFGSYVSPHAASRIVKEGGLLEGEEREVTVLFLDIRDFTAFAERTAAAQVVAFLNDFFGLVVPVIVDHGGYPNRIIGDGLLAAFGAPEPLSDHAARALASALEIAARVENAYEGEVRIGIGLNSGPVVAGTISGGPKLEYTLTGDTVNVASRVEQLTKETGDVILVTQETRRLAETSGPLELQPRGAIELKGKSEPVQIYAPVREHAVEGVA